MNEFLFLVPVSLVLGALGLCAFLWSLGQEQYDDLDGAGERILHDEDRPLPDDVRPRAVRSSGDDAPGEGP